LLAGPIVAVPAAPTRSLRRGFDPAEEIAARLAAVAGLPLQATLRRANARPQVGRTRADRLSDPPRIWAAEAAPRTVLLLDDVQTTGATLRACAEALHSAGAERVAAATFARTL
jgi:predicted amidophosphoribosyltransferase